MVRRDTQEVGEETARQGVTSGRKRDKKRVAAEGRSRLAGGLRIRTQSETRKIRETDGDENSRIQREIKRQEAFVAYRTLTGRSGEVEGVNQRVTIDLRSGGRRSRREPGETA